LIQLGELRRAVTRIGPGRLVAIVLMLALATYVARWSWTVPLMRDAERPLYDFRAIVATPHVPEDKRIVMVVFNDDTLERTGRRFPLDRALLARALTRIDQLGARAIGIDILIDQPQPEDPKLIAALRAMRTPVFLAFATSQNNKEAMLPFQETFLRHFQAEAGTAKVRPASIRLETEDDGVMRSWPGRPPGLPQLLVNAMAPDRPWPADYRGSITFRLPEASEDNSERFVFSSLPIDLFDNDIAARAFKSQIAGRYVLVGGDISDIDRFDTTLTRLTGKTTSGLEVHASMLAQLLDGHLLSTPPNWLLWTAAVVIILIGAAIGFADLAGWRLGLLLLSALAALAVTPFLLQQNGVDTQHVPMFGWMFGWSLAYSASAAISRSIGSEQRRFAQSALGKYLPRDVAAAILRDPSQLALTGERRTIYALFSDLEGFTALTHAVAPETIASLLNAYLDRLSEIVLAHGGTLDKFVGDAVVAFWGAPIARPDDADRALAAAIAMVAAGEAFRAEAPADVPPIGRTRVGVHRGEAIVGNFGGEGRIQYTALGDAMNTAARLEAANKTLRTSALISETAVAGLTEPQVTMRTSLRPMGRVRLRGRATPIQVYEPVTPADNGHILELTTLFDRFETGDEDALAAMEVLAAGRSDDVALKHMLYRLRQAGPGGYSGLG
jgi:adenylate cyclase